MNNVIVFVFLSTVDKANVVAQNGIEVDDLFVPVLSLSSPLKKITLSNVLIKNEL